LYPEYTIYRSAVSNSNDYVVSNDLKSSFGLTSHAFPLCYGSPPGPTPTPTIDPNSDYCNEVEARPEYLDDEIGLTLPIPRYGQGTCIQIGGWSIGISWLESVLPSLFDIDVPDSIGVPGFNLCVHPFVLGYFNLFGILIDMDLLLLAISLIMIMRWIANN
jgi:hypothetical protein